MEPVETGKRQVSQSEGRMKLLKYSLVGVAGLLLLVVAGAAFTAPKIDLGWTPDPLTPESIAPGKSATYTVVLTNLGKSSIAPTNQLHVAAEGAVAPYLTITHPVFPKGTFQSGDTISFDVTVSVPSDAPVGVFEGTLFLQRVLPNGRVKEAWQAEGLSIELSVVATSVTWAPASLSFKLAPGESMTATTAFVPSSAGSNVTISVLPELASYVTVTPSSFANVAPGQSYLVSVTAQAPVVRDTILSTYDGTISLQESGNTLAQPLPISLFLTDEEGDIYISDPRGGTFVVNKLLVRLADNISQEVAETLFPSLGIEISWYSETTESYFVRTSTRTFAEVQSLRAVLEEHPSVASTVLLYQDSIATDAYDLQSLRSVDTSYTTAYELARVFDAWDMWEQARMALT